MVVLHSLERLTLARMVSRFGWKSVLWTGWLGTPVHEFSHAIMCVVFRHRIEEMALFQPDLESGRLGYVRHAYEKRSWFQEIGNVFIGIAPLIGGTLSLLLLLRVFFPGAISESLVISSEASSLGEQLFAISAKLFERILSPGAAHWKTILFIYFVLCIGTHMAPSWSDYQGAWKGALWLILIALVTVMIAGVLLPSEIDVSTYLLPWLAPVLAIFALVAVMCSVGTLAVFAVTTLVDIFLPRPRT